MFACFDRRRHWLEIGLGFSRACHAIDQERREFVALNRVDQPCSNFGLIIGKVRHVMVWIGRREGAVNRDLNRFDEASPHHAAQNPFGNLRNGGEFADRRLLACQLFESLFALRRKAGRFGSFNKPVFGHRGGAIKRTAGRNHHPCNCR